LTSEHLQRSSYSSSLVEINPQKEGFAEAMKKESKTFSEHLFLDKA
jgi:hypothetical protein